MLLMYVELHQIIQTLGVQVVSATVMLTKILDVQISKHVFVLQMICACCCRGSGTIDCFSCHRTRDFTSSLSCTVPALLIQYSHIHLCVDVITRK